MNKSREVSFGTRRKNKIQSRWNDQTVGPQLYLLAITLFLAAETLSTTMFPVPGRVLLLGRGAAVLFVFLKIVLYDRFSPRLFWRMIVLLFLGVLIAAVSGYTEPFFWMVMVLGAKNVSWKKILQIYLLIAVSIVLLAFLASMLDVIENLRYTRDNSIKMRNSFGIIYTTDFASHIFSILLVFFYLMKEKVRLWYYGAAIVLACLVYRFCYTRLDVGCIFLMIAMFFVLNLLERRKAVEKKYCNHTKYSRIYRWTMPFLALIMFAASYAYRDDSSIMVKADVLASGRLKLGNIGLKQYGLSLFGKYIEMVGNGGTTLKVKEYFFVDCSYIYVFLCYGVLFFLVVLAAYVACCKKMAGDRYYLAAIIVISINCMIAHHLAELAYNPFVLVLLADVAVSDRPGSYQMKWVGRYRASDF